MIESIEYPFPLGKESEYPLGREVWYSHMEYHNEHTGIRGYPYYLVTQQEDYSATRQPIMYYLWKLEMREHEKRMYRIIETSTDSSWICDKGVELERIVKEEYRKAHPHWYSGWR
ncbi:MAG: hypothetical protein HQM11_18355 [SAR324 cluster bacterium]|nr:hypothetical protein [SAR324 cluster bacterium]